MSKYIKSYLCDNKPFECPFNAQGGMDCRNFCGLGVTEEEVDFSEEMSD